MPEQPLFECVSFESVIAARQKKYYRILAAYDAVKDCIALVEFCAPAIIKAFQKYSDNLVQQHGHRFATSCLEMKHSGSNARTSMGIVRLASSENSPSVV